MTITLFQVQGTRSDHLLTDERLGAWNVREVGAGSRHEPLRAIVARRIPVSAQRAEQADVEGVIGHWPMRAAASSDQRMRSRMAAFALCGRP